MSRRLFDRAPIHIPTDLDVSDPVAVAVRARCLLDPAHIENEETLYKRTAVEYADLLSNQSEPGELFIQVGRTPSLERMHDAINRVVSLDTDDVPAAPRVVAFSSLWTPGQRQGGYGEIDLIRVGNAGTRPANVQEHARLAVLNCVDSPDSLLHFVGLPFDVAAAGSVAAETQLGQLEAAQAYYERVNSFHKLRGLNGKAIAAIVMQRLISGRELPFDQAYARVAQLQRMTICKDVFPAQDDTDTAGASVVASVDGVTHEQITYDRSSGEASDRAGIGMSVGPHYV